MSIDTREELINALVTAAELEHGLMVQYLYATMTLKNDATEGLTPDQVAMVKRWSSRIRGVAKQEMGHLATVLNLLEAVGGGSYLNRMRLPSATGLYTPPIPFRLEPLTLETITRFVQFETPAHPVAVALEGLAPDQIVVEHVGQLYGDIRTCVGNIDEARLFIGRGTAQDQSSWSFTITVSPVTNRDTAFAAIDSIIVEGEGSSTGQDNSHYGRFKAIRDEYRAELTASPAFQPHRDVVANPATLEPPVPDTSAITDPTTKDVAELFNACYTTLLLILVKYYRFDETPENQDAFQSIAKVMMMTVLARVGPLLSQLPAGSGKNAGPPFEIYTLPSLPNDRSASLVILRERVEAARVAAGDLATHVPNDGVLERVAEALGDILDTIPQ